MDYRFSFQGQEKDDELHGSSGTSYAFEYRMHDPRVGRFLSIDPLAAKYAYNSPYAFSENRVIDGVEIEGLEWGMGAAISHYLQVYGSSGAAAGTNPGLGDRVEDAASKGPAIWAGDMLLRNADIRRQYNLEKSKLVENTPENRAARDLLREKYRAKTPEPIKSYLDNLRPLADESNRPKTNPSGGGAGMTKIARVGGYAGGAMLGVGMYQSANTIVTAENPIIEGASEATGWAGTLYVGGEFAAYGTATAGPWGGLAGAVVGGAGGFFFGKTFGDALFKENGKTGQEWRNLMKRQPADSNAE